MAFQLSPGVVTSEIDLTTVVPAAATSTGAFAGHFTWGPSETPVAIADETQLVQVFGKPETGTAYSFFTCANFLSYGNDLRVVRSVNSNITSAGIANAYAAVTATSNASYNVCIKSDQDYYNNYYTSNNNFSGVWAARYPGSQGNSLKVSVWANTNSASFTTTNWDYAGYFTGCTGTSNYANNIIKGANDEIHIVVVDANGAFTGVKNSVLETYPFLSVASDAKDDQGNSIYYKEVLYRKSKYVYAIDPPSTSSTLATWNKTVTAANTAAAAGTLSTNAFISLTSANTITLTGGTSGNNASISDSYLQNAISKFANSEEIDISLLMLGGHSNNASIVNYAVSSVAEVRKDCVVFISPPLANVTATDPASSITNWRNNVINVNSSYAVLDSGWKYQYDKYNDVYRWIPLNGDIAGLCARTDTIRDPWFSPAGLNRGQIKNLVKLAYNPNKTDRDTLYKNGVNPVVSFPGDGVLLFGDKTLLSKPSAFDRINVRRLFIVLEKAISRAARAQLFEFNDEFTRSQFVSIVEPFLRDVKGRRGVYDYKVVCDETNNTAQVIDNNQFVGDIYIKPARSINFIQLNFVAVRSGVAFEEVVGKF